LKTFAYTPGCLGPVKEKKKTYFDSLRSLYSIYLCQFESIRSGLFVIKRQFQGNFLVVKLKSSLRKLYGRRHDLVNRHWMSMSKMTTVMFLCRDHNRVIPSSFVTSHRICNTTSTTDATGRTRAACLSGKPEFNPGF